MRYTKRILLLLGAMFFTISIASASQKWTRQEAVYTVKQVIIEPTKDQNITPVNEPMNLLTQAFKMYEAETLNNFQPISRGETLTEVVKKLTHSKMNLKEAWYLKEEIKFLNKTQLIGDEFIKGSKLRVPLYQPLLGNARSCSDMRNILVAVMKGEKYGVHWAYMIGVRSQENPSPNRDHYAYGVVCRKGTNLWTQAEWGAKILRRVTGASAKNPSYGNIQRASVKYVGYETSDWPRNVWAVYKRCQGG